jgi:taurine--2-oxoglutarate transaminase
MDHWNTAPDILVTAKGITSAYVPLGLCATTSKVASYFEDHYFPHGHTYEAHPLTLAPAIAAIREMQRLNLNERSQELGQYLGTRLADLKVTHPSIGDVRGLGLFWAVELVKNRDTKELMNTKEEKISGKPLVVDIVAAEMMKQGVFMQAWVSHFVLAPPLIVTKEDIDVAVSVLDRALNIADRECS